MARSLAERLRADNNRKSASPRKRANSKRSYAMLLDGLGGRSDAAAGELSPSFRGQAG
jgi:hypothetical protein